MQVDESELDWTEYDEDETTFRRKELGDAAGTDQLGCSLYELPPGEKSWPYHYHTANEEAIYVLAGAGQVRTPDGTRSVSEGVFVSFPADESGGHRVINDTDEPLRYLAVSTMNEPDVTLYPDKEMFGVYVGSPPGGRDERTFEGYFPTDAETEYWD
ncbi:cupin domain-containing protein [Halovenus sp. WSH3]|uniref:Cupin domain-containing protein n=1 Tax=Halovenus carboxidivorans TaxID=2692199 RepID=A0A6B0SYR8_9EURY|nr:cupin domain-containing protein [Halovenus carboxidivorans]MXR50734.1 cupin domain-containing protein [Halovenus carboxidivorans]